MNRSQLVSKPDEFKIGHLHPAPQARDIQLKGSIELSRNHVDMHPVEDSGESRAPSDIQTSSGALSTSQFEFCRGHSCSDLLLSVVDDWLSARNSKLCTAVVFLDLSKAFDNVDHQSLLLLLQNAELEGQFLAGSKMFLKTGGKGLFFLELVLSQTGLFVTREYHKEVCWGLSSLMSTFLIWKN